MPPFKLELPDKYIGSYRRLRIVHTKNEYSEGVKFRNWERFRESKPIDVDPFCPGKLNHFVSHYNRLGTQDYEYTTTTGDMLKQIGLKKDRPKQAHMNNYYTFNDDGNCPTAFSSEYSQFCKDVCSDEFVTTMQHDYTPPRPCILSRVAFPTIPYMQNRKYKNHDPRVSPYKFYDDNYIKDTCQLIKHKTGRSTSFNPGLGQYELGNVKVEL